MYNLLECCDACRSAYDSWLTPAVTVTVLYTVPVPGLIVRDRGIIVRAARRAGAGAAVQLL